MKVDHARIVRAVHVRRAEPPHTGAAAIIGDTRRVIGKAVFVGFRFLRREEKYLVPVQNIFRRCKLIAICAAYKRLVAFRGCNYRALFACGKIIAVKILAPRLRVAALPCVAIRACVIEIYTTPSIAA